MFQNMEKRVQRMVLTEEKQKEIKAQIDPNKAQLYYDYPELMANLPEQEKELYQKNNDNFSILPRNMGQHYSSIWCLVKQSTFVGCFFV